MLYNISKEKVWKNVDCLTCEYFDADLKKCFGFGKNCVEYDPKTKTAIDPVTKLPLKRKRR